MAPWFTARAAPLGRRVLARAGLQLLPPRPCGPKCGRPRSQRSVAALASPGGGDLAFDSTDGAADALFPELQQPGAQCVLLGVDPDIQGAIAVLRWRNGGGGGGAGLPPALEGVELAIHDMPVEVWRLGRRDKRQPSAAALTALLRSTAAEAARAGAVLRAVVEYTTPQHISGKHAWYGIGFSIGLLHGLMEAEGVAYQRVPATLWKRQMGLVKLGKEGSLALARQIFPAAEPELRRKKDHGRAEALLLAAWGFGTRAALIMAPEGAAEASQGEEAEGKAGISEEGCSSSDEAGSGSSDEAGSGSSDGADAPGSGAAAPRAKRAPKAAPRAAKAASAAAVRRREAEAEGAVELQPAAAGGEELPSIVPLRRKSPRKAPATSPSQGLEA